MIIQRQNTFGRDFVLMDDETNMEVGHVCSLNPYSGYISGVYIEDGYRRRGLGYKMMQWVKKCAEKIGLNQLTLEVYKDNKQAVRLYTKLGFHIVTDKSDEYVWYMQLEL